MKKIILNFTLILLATNLFAVKVVKERDHWGIFGGFAVVQESSRGHFDASGNWVIDVVYLKCFGDGSDKCSYDGLASGGDILGSSGEGIINDIFKSAEQLVESGNSSGGFSETHAFLQEDGSYRYYRYHAIWNEENPDIIEIEINEIFY